MQPIQGRSLTPIFRSEKNGRVEEVRDHVLLGQERHDVGRPNDAGYPVRSIICEGMRYLHHFKPDRWPMGNPDMTKGLVFYQIVSFAGALTAELIRG